jgi:ATP-dependent exoDNAse (exonuclease V) beta subunit
LLKHREIGTQHALKLPAQGEKIIGRVAGVIAAAWQQRYRKPLRTWIEGTWLALGGPAALGSDETAAKVALHQCRQYFDLLESHTKGAVTIDDWPRFQYAVEQLYAEPLTDQEPSANQEPETHDPNPAPLQIMTIHKSKGLEFDTVIIPGLDRRGANNSHELLLWRERINKDGNNQLLLSPPQKLGAGDDALYTHLKREENIKSRLENTRVLYVACTRAIQRLHLLFRQPLKNAAAGSLLASAWPVLEKHVTAGAEGEQPLALDNCAVTLHQPSYVANAEQSDEQAAESANQQSYSFRLPANWRSPFVDNNASPNTNNSPAMAENKPPAINLPGASDPRKIGTLLHRTLRLLVIEGIEQWTPERINKQQSSWAIQIKQAGIVDTKGALAVLNEALDKCLADHTQHWIFDRSHRQSYCEFALNYLDQQGRISSAIIDRCFIIDDTQWIVDYKTSLPTPGQSLDDFLQQQGQAYQAQLALYAQTLAQLQPESLNQSSVENPLENTAKLKAALYFPLLSHLEIVIDQ